MEFRGCHPLTPGPLVALTSHEPIRGASDVHSQPTSVGLAKTHLPGCLWGQDLLQVQGTPETEIQGARPYGDAIPAANVPGSVAFRASGVLWSIHGMGWTRDGSEGDGTAGVSGGVL